MNKRVWTKVLKSAADPLRARTFLDALKNTPAIATLEKTTAEQARILVALLSGSQVLGNWLLAHPRWINVLEADRLRFPRRDQGFRNEVNAWLCPMLESQDYVGAMSHLRAFKQREMLRIAARDLARLGDVSQITRELSDVADICLNSVWRICEQQFTERHGQPWHQDVDGQWQRTKSCVLGMGKLGGQELNYSSDVDVLFVYGEEGRVFKEPPTPTKTPRSVLKNHPFFNRLAESFIAEVSKMTPDGALFRIDLRLRPEGDAGPLCRSLGSYENYYAQWGQTWERMMLIKARGVAGDPGIAAEFLEMIHPFRYPRSISEGVLHEIRAMKERIETEVLKPDELKRNVKLGRGGIREIEFVVQSQQLLHAGKQPFLQSPQTLPTLEKLAQYRLLPIEETRDLRDAYCFLRDVEHRLQMEENLQTHTIPTNQATQTRLAKLMGLKTAEKFEARRSERSGRVRTVFDKLITSPQPAEVAARFPREFAGLESRWKTILAEHGFSDPEKAFQVLREFVEGPGYIHVSTRAIGMGHRLLPKLLALCPQPNQHSGRMPREGLLGGISSKAGRQLSAVLSDPDRVVTRLDGFIAAYGTRQVLFELWNSNPSIFELLLLLFDRSEFLAELAIRTPDLVDELVASGRLRQRKTAVETLRDLRHGFGDRDQRLWLRRYHETELMRIGLRDILGLADPEQYLTELSALADACLQYALEVVTRRFRLRNPPITIIGLGKLGGSEIDYGSDLDILFVASSKTKHLPRLQQMGVEIMDLLSCRTEAGLVFHTDARLRPDGEKGLLVNTLAVYEEYYHRRARLWEVQSLTRTRAVAGDPMLGEKFQQLALNLTHFNKPNLTLAAYSPNWKQEIHKMRMRIEKERTPAGKDELAVKTGRGGLMDAEFIAQALSLEHGWHETNTLRALERGKESGVLPDAQRLIQNYRLLRRVEGILRRWSYEGETVLPDDPAAFRRVSVRCGFETPEIFRATLASCREAIRAAYRTVFHF